MKDPDAKYAAAAERHGKSTGRGSAASSSRAYNQPMEALQELRAPDRGEAALLDLTNHQSDRVRVWASTHLLPLNETQALAALEKLTAVATTAVHFNAKMLLEEWRAGRFKVPREWS